MSAPVEAQSLSALTHLFANPPQYPRNPTHQVHPPLVLYIVRVPGSRDVFLSPLKPPTKASISLEAIQSSLYYLHVNTDEDEEVRRSAEAQQSSEESPRQSATISRKPLPGSATQKHPLPPMPPTHEPPPPYQAYQPYGPGPVNEPALNIPTDLRINTDVHNTASRKPVSPGVPSVIDRPTGDYALSPSIHEAQTVTPSLMDDLPRSAPSRTALPQASTFGRSTHTPANVDGHDHAYTPANLDTARRTDPKHKSVTLIRRDPASGGQWNIGTISFLRPTVAASNIRPVAIELNTPGYNRFTKSAGFETPRPGSAGSDAVSIKRTMESATLTPHSATTPSHTLPFARVVDFRRMTLSEIRRTMYQRSNSSDAAGKMEPPKPGLEKNVLAFDSPWHGQCTFINGIDGNSLKIKHTIKSNTSTAEGVTATAGELRLNLGWSFLSNIKEARKRGKEPEPDTLPIPELLKTKKDSFRKSIQHFKEKSRESFQKGRASRNNDEDVLRDLSNINTPITNNLNENGQNLPSIYEPGLYSGEYHRPSHDYVQGMSSSHPTSSEDNEDDAPRLSLKLGREKAGGGFRGDSAKLGKLIIEDEGLKMCDLIVGAAMGVWWQHYGD